MKNSDSNNSGHEDSKNISIYWENEFDLENYQIEFDNWEEINYENKTNILFF